MCHLRQIVAVRLAVSFFFSVWVLSTRFKQYLFCFSALVLLVKGPSVQLTQPGLSLCPLFTMVVTGPMEAQTKGGLFHLSCPGLSGPLWAPTELRARCCQRSTGEFDLRNLTAMVRWQMCEWKTMAEEEKKVREKKDRKMYSFNWNHDPFKSNVGNCCNVNTCSH